MMSSDAGRRMVPTPPMARNPESCDRAHMHAIARGWILGVAILAGALGCGGGTSPTSDFCQQSSAGMCHRAYACTPAAMQDANFHNIWGPSEATCASGLAQLCTTECSGKAVDDAAKTQCYSDINAQACSTVSDGTLGNSCAAVCVDAPTGAGGSSGGTLSDPIVFCKMTFDAACTRAFQCIPTAMQDANFTDIYGASVTSCKAMFEAACIDPTTNCPTYNQTLGASCISAVNGSACTDLFFSNDLVFPGSCSAACGM